MLNGEQRTPPGKAFDVVHLLLRHSHPCLGRQSHQSGNRRHRQGYMTWQETQTGLHQYMTWQETQTGLHNMTGDTGKVTWHDRRHRQGYMTWQEMQTGLNNMTGDTDRVTWHDRRHRQGYITWQEMQTGLHNMTGDTDRVTWHEYMYKHSHKCGTEPYTDVRKREDMA